jgi:hypothetical protein
MLAERVHQSPSWNELIASTKICRPSQSAQSARSARSARTYDRVALVGDGHEARAVQQRGIPLTRLVWYVVFSLVVAFVLSAVGLPTPIVVGYLVIAAVGFVMVVRDLQAAAMVSRAAFRRDMYAARDRIVARAEDAQAWAKTQPWYDEVNAAQAAAMDKGASPIGIFSTFNPFWTLPLDRLVQLGITTEEEVLSTIKLASEATPEKWLNGFLLKDLSDAGYSDLESVARVGLFTTFQERATTPNRPSA